MSIADFALSWALTCLDFCVQNLGLLVCARSEAGD